MVKVWGNGATHIDDKVAESFRSISQTGWSHEVSGRVEEESG